MPEDHAPVRRPPCPSPVEGAAAPFVDVIEPGLHAREWRVSDRQDLQVFLVLARRAFLLDGHGRTELPAPALAWLPGGRGQTLRLEAGASGHRLVIRIDRMLAALSGLSGGARMRPLIGRQVVIPSARIAQRVAEVAHSFEVLAREVREARENADAVTAAHLALLCVHVSRLADTGLGAARPPPELAASIAQRFHNLVEVHLCDGWSVRRYADELGVTMDRLQAATIRGNGKAPGHILTERLLAETRSRLARSDLPAEQIAFSLGFRDSSYFSRFCRKHLGSPPGRYRRMSRGGQPGEAGDSFAAWP